jgi:PAS domain S-box-containing protein
VREVLADAHVLYGAIHPDDLPVLADAEAVTIRDLSVVRSAVRLQRADGEWRRVELASAPRPQAEGTVVRDGLMLDVTERHHEQQQLRRVLRTLRTLSNAGRVLIRATDEAELLQQICDVVRDDGGYPLVTVGCIVHDEAQSVSMMAMAGTPASLAHARNLKISWGPMPSGMGPTGRAVHDGTIQRSSNFLTDPVMAPWREAVIRADLSSLIVLPLKVDGIVIGTLNVYSSIADAGMGVFDAEETTLLAELADNLAFGIRLLRAQQARAAADAARSESETRLRQLAETINEVFRLQDAATKRMLYVSPAFEQLWGHPPALLDDGDPMAWLRTVHPDDRARVAEADARDRLLGRYDIEYRIVRLDGAVRWIHDRAVPIRDEAGTVVRIAGVAEDVTARRAAEDQLRQAQKMEAIGQLAGGVAHDFNNILAAIRLQTELAMQEPGVTPTVSEALATVRDSARRAADLTRQLLLFGRRSVMQPVPVDLTEVVTGVTRMLQRTLREDIALQVQVGGGPLPLVADPTMLDQVIVNLVVNARDAMPTGGRLVLAAERRRLAASEPGLLLDAPPATTPACASPTRAAASRRSTSSASSSRSSRRSPQASARGSASRRSSASCARHVRSD